MRPESGLAVFCLGRYARGLARVHLPCEVPLVKDQFLRQTYLRQLLRSKPAWFCVEVHGQSRDKLDRALSEGPGGVQYLLQLVEEQTGKQPLLDIGGRLEEFFYRVKRHNAEKIAARCLRHRAAYHRLCLASRRMLGHL